MAKLALKKGATDVTVYLFIQDSSVTTVAGLTGLTFETASLACYYVRPLGAASAITLTTQTVTGAHSNGGFVEVDATNMPGIYRLDLPDAVCATGADSAVVMLKGSTNLTPVALEIQLTDFDLNSTSNSVGAVASVTGDVTLATGEVLDLVVVGSYTIQDVLKIMASVLAGKLTGGGTTEVTFRGIDDTSDVVVATVDADGNRSTVTITV